MDIEQKRKELKKQKYGLVGSHSGVQVCQWTKNSLNGKGVCWKEKFYGVKSRRCCQMSVSLFNCENRCLHCWRDTDYSVCGEVENPEEPKEILDKIIEERKKLLIGYKGSVSKKKWEEAIKPNLFSFSLSGEATLYPKLAEMFLELKKRKAIIFLVTNGQNPEKIRELAQRDALPTQIAVSTNAPNKKLFNVWCRSSKKDAWKKFNETIDLLRELKGKVRRVVRLTLAKKSETNPLSNMEDENIKEYASLIKRAEPDFVHIKGFMNIGYSRKRMGYDKMPWHKEIKDFAKSLVKELDGYKILAQEKRSCVVVLGKSKKDMKIKV